MTQMLSDLCSIFIKVIPFYVLGSYLAYKAIDGRRLYACYYARGRTGSTISF